VYAGLDPVTGKRTYLLGDDHRKETKWSRFVIIVVNYVMPAGS
jgi:hypothetical protein